MGLFVVVILCLTPTACWSYGRKKDNWNLLPTALQRLRRNMLEEPHPQILLGIWIWSGWQHHRLQAVRWDSGNFEGGIWWIPFLHVERMWIVVDRRWTGVDSIYQRWVQQYLSHTHTSLCATEFWGSLLYSNSNPIISMRVKGDQGWLLDFGLVKWGKVIPLAEMISNSFRGRGRGRGEEDGKLQLSFGYVIFGKCMRHSDVISSFRIPKLP